MHTLPRYASAVSFILLRTMDETSSAEKVFSSPLYSTLIMGLLAWLITVNGQCFMSDCTEASLNFLPIRRLASTMRKQTMDNTLILQDGEWWRTRLSDKLTHEQAPHQKLCCWGSWRLGFWLRRRPAFLCLWTLHNWGWFGYPDRWRWFPPSHAGKLQHRNMWYQDLFQWLAVLACSCCWKKISPSLKYKFETKKQIIESINQPILNHQIIFLFIIILKLTKNAIFVDNKTFSPHVMSTCWLTKGWMKILSKLKKMIIFIQLNKISCSTKSLDLTFFKIDIPDVLFLPLSPLLNFTGLLLRPACPDL